ncbi:transcription factor EGL1-like [Cynara cardunculus var. scolymus]|uniref:transcription factor EGL1-like n=1 Tax=Cynara cardunculus var. scolymus TaxID=59895 RepID=UPI000D62E504|nr:transcription factor EGL1-like [Cynara cardunculus var. scolymus]
MTAMENLRQKLAMAVKSIQWSYAIFWSISSTEPGVLTWCDGYYNGDIKTRKTIQAEEMNDDYDDNEDDDEVGLQRTEQLRQLYESLSAAAETHQHEPQARKPSAALSPEDLSDAEWYFLVCMTYEFSDGQGLPGRTLAENTSCWLSNAHFADSKVFSRSLLAKSASIQTVVCFPYLEGIVEFGITEKVLEEQNIIKQIKGFIFGAPPQKVLEIPLESCSGMLDRDLTDNNLDGFHEYDQNLVTKSRNSPKSNLNHSLMVEDVNIGGFQSQEQRWQLVDEEEEGEVSFYHNNSMGSSDCISQNLVSDPSDLWSDDDSRYQGVLSKIFKNTQRLILGPHFRNCDFKESAFISWKNYDGIEWKGSCSQMLLKKVLYEVPKMHRNRLVRPCDENGILDQLQKLEADDANNINHRFSVLSSLVPSRGKVDKVSLLDDTIDYLKMLERRVEALQSNKHVGDKENKKSQDLQERTSDNYAIKRKASCDLEDLQEECLSDCITVSVIEKDVAIEIQCRWRDNMMVQVFDAISSLNLESHSVHSSIADGILTLSIESKLKSCTTLTAKMIRQALQRVIGRH